jgi:hypothetical protein
MYYYASFRAEGSFLIHTVPTWMLFQQEKKKALLFRALRTTSDDSGFNFGGGGVY